MSKDLRTFLKEFALAYPDQIKTIGEEVDPRFELTAIVEKFEAQGQDPVVFFRKVKGSAMPVIANLCATYDRLAFSMDATKESMVDEYGKREKNRLPLTEVKNAPVKEVMYKGDQMDLNILPWITHNGLDAGPYFSSPVTLMKDPETGRVNVGVYRIQIKNPRKLMLQCNPANHGHHILRKHMATKTPVQVAMVIGHHPGLLMAGVAKLEEVGGELEVAGGLMGEPLEVVKGETVDLPIPARAEVVIEGVVEDPTAMEDEGPFGEWTHYTAGKSTTPWVTPTAIYMRKDALFLDNISSHNDHAMLGALPRMGSILRRIRGVMPSVKAVNLPASGCARTSLYISMKKGVEGEPKRAAMIALSAEANIRLVICVDDDINVFNEEEVLWAVSTRFQADKDLIIMPNCLGNFAIPVGYDYTRTTRGPLDTKLIFDATTPLPPIEFPRRAAAPPEVVKRVNLEKLQVKGMDSDLAKRINMQA